MTRPAPGLAPTILLYAAARLGLVAIVAGLLVAAGVPLLLAALIGLIVALPLSMLLFRGLRGRLDAALAVATARRSEQRAALRARLRGDDLRGDDGGGPLDGSDDGRQAQPDGGQDRPAQ